MYHAISCNTKQYNNMQYHFICKASLLFSSKYLLFWQLIGSVAYYLKIFYFRCCLFCIYFASMVRNLTSWNFKWPHIQERRRSKNIYPPQTFARSSSFCFRTGFYPGFHSPGLEIKMSFIHASIHPQTSQFQMLSMFGPNSTSSFKL